MSLSIASFTVQFVFSGRVFARFGVLAFGGVRASFWDFGFFGPLSGPGTQFGRRRFCDKSIVFSPARFFASFQRYLAGSYHCFPQPGARCIYYTVRFGGGTAVVLRISVAESFVPRLAHDDVSSPGPPSAILRKSVSRMFMAVYLRRSPAI